MRTFLLSLLLMIAAHGIQAQTASTNRDYHQGFDLKTTPQELWEDDCFPMLYTQLVTQPDNPFNQMVAVTNDSASIYSSYLHVDKLEPTTGYVPDSVERYVSIYVYRYGLQVGDTVRFNVSIRTPGGNYIGKYNAYMVGNAYMWNPQISIPRDYEGDFDIRIDGFSANRDFTGINLLFDNINGKNVRLSDEPCLGVRTPVLEEPEAPLPVTLVDFRATKSQLLWSTASEVNTSHFEVQRSMDGRVFETMGRVSAFGNSTVTRRYSYTVGTPYGNAYYRLRIVDNDSTFEFSKSIVISNTASMRRFIVFDIPGEETPQRLLLYDIYGRVIGVYDNPSPDFELPTGRFVVARLQTDKATYTHTIMRTTK
jgi:signal peptidase I